MTSKNQAQVFVLGRKPKMPVDIKKRKEIEARVRFYGFLQFSERVGMRYKSLYNKCLGIQTMFPEDAERIEAALNAK